MALQSLMLDDGHLAKLVTLMRYRGVNVDQGYVEACMKEEAEKESAARLAYAERVGEEFFDSPSHLKPVFDRFGIPFAYTEKNNPSFSEGSLTVFVVFIFFYEGHENTLNLIELIHEIRAFAKRKSTYWLPFLKKLDPDTKRLHAEPKPFGTQTGRFSYQNPNLQNIPKDEEGFLSVRRALIPDHSFLCLDYDQVEYRIMADLAGEYKLIDAINQGEDIHQATADLLKITRTQAKTVNFAILYGCGSKTLAKMLGCAVHEATDIKAKYFSRLAKIKRLIDSTQRKALVQGYVINWAGRPLRLPGPKGTYMMPNHLVQSSAADVIRKAMVQLYQRHESTSEYTDLAVMIHDELVLDVPQERLSETYTLCKEVMEGVYEASNDVRLTVSAKASSVSLSERDLKVYAPGI